MDTATKSLLDGLRFDIFERVNLAESDKNIELIEETELTPQIKMLMRKDEIQLVGNLLLKIKYASGEMPWADNEFKHSIPVEITIPANRVSDAWLLDADIENFNIEQLGSRSLNITGVMKIYEKEQIKVESNKVKLPKEVAEAIESVKSPENPTIYAQINEYEMKWKSYFPQVHMDTIIKALVNGYEVEQTPEDKVREYVEHLRNWRDKTEHPPERCRAAEYSGRIDSVMQTLTLFNIKIKGVND